MTARETILGTIRANLPRPAVPLPDSPTTTDHAGTKGGVGWLRTLDDLGEVGGFPEAGESLVPYFRRHLDAMGGRSFEVADAAAARAKIAELFPAATVICSATAEVAGTRRAGDVADPRDLADVDVAVVRSRLGVAESGSVWLGTDDLQVPSLGVLTQHLVVLLDPETIVPTLHDAYGAKLDLAGAPYGTFMSGPSATADIEGVVIYGAQGARTMTILLLPAPHLGAN